MMGTQAGHKKRARQSAEEAKPGRRQEEACRDSCTSPLHGPQPAVHSGQRSAPRPPPTHTHAQGVCLPAILARKHITPAPGKNNSES